MKIFGLLLTTVGFLGMTADANDARWQSDSSIINIASKDGTPIAAECAGTGPSLVIVLGVPVTAAAGNLCSRFLRRASPFVRWIVAATEQVVIRLITLCMQLTC